MAENPYNDGRCNVGGAGTVKALHNRRQTEKPKVIRGNDLRTGNKSK